MKHIIIFGGIVALIVVGSIIFKYEKPADKGSQSACTKEAKICPDGSAVGRAGPKCEFTKCPVVKGTAGTMTSLGKTITVEGVLITPTTVVEDSRCPVNVQCIQAGTVRVITRLESEGNKQEVTLTLNTPITFAGKRVELQEVTPVKNTKTAFEKDAYVFKFVVTKAVTVIEKGTLAGHVSISPVCPVEYVDNPCKPTAEMYAAAKVFVYTPDKKILLKTITPDAEGNFSLALSVGSYFIDMVHQRIGSMTGAPTTIVITSGKTTTLSLRVDTGIR